MIVRQRIREVRRTGTKRGPPLSLGYHRLPAWRQHLRLDFRADYNHSCMPKYSLKRLLIVVTVIACGIGFLRAAYVHFTHFEAGEDLSSVDWLPKSASRVSYYKSYGFTAYEFDISESDFKKWSRWDVNEIGEPVTVLRYTYFARRLPPLDPNPSQSELDRANEHYMTSYAEVYRGLFHEHRRSNGGGVTLAYDRVRGRAYFQSNPR
jgi:hypothetical protein